jgi:Arc/MetJ-type ribon-helix-helix transcriptional regulator
MVTISADVTKEMLFWADKKVKEGLYKSRSEVIREMFRDKMENSDNFYMVSKKAFDEAWGDEDDEYWESFL